jgi:hypothetical protein
MGRRTHRRQSDWVLAPAKDIPVRISVDGVEVNGTIRYLVPNEISITIATTGRETFRHIPYFQMPRRDDHFAALDEQRTHWRITKRGQERAEELLTALYADERRSA